MFHVKHYISVYSYRNEKYNEIYKIHIIIKKLFLLLPKNM